MRKPLLWGLRRCRASALAMVTAALLEAVRPLRAAAPALAVERLVARLREQRPELDAGAEQVGAALRAQELAATVLLGASPPFNTPDANVYGDTETGPFQPC